MIVVIDVFLRNEIAVFHFLCILESNKCLQFHYVFKQAVVQNNHYIGVTRTTNGASETIAYRFDIYPTI